MRVHFRIFRNAKNCLSERGRGERKEREERERRERRERNTQQSEAIFGVCRDKKGDET